MKKTTERKWAVVISLLCLLIWLGIFLNFIGISLPAGNGFSGILMEKIGIRNGRITFSLYHLFRGLLSLEYDWSLVGTPAKELYILIFLIVLPYILVLAIAILAWLRGKWRYAVMAGFSAFAVFDMVYGMLVRLPGILGAYLEDMMGDKALKLVEMAIDEPLSGFLQKNIVSYMRVGFWGSVVLLAVIYLLSVVLFAFSWKGRSH